MIKFILNGYFRSGTTIMWYIFKQQHPELVCLYEPLNPALPKYVRENIGKIDPLHNLVLFDDYLKLPNLDEVISKHRGDEFFLVDRFEVVKDYLDAIHRSVDTMLQPNRMHFIMSDVVKRYKCKAVQLVRHPADVYMDILNICGENPGAFGMDRYYDYLLNKYGIEAKDHLEMFLIVWTFCNYEATKDGNVEVWKFEDCVKKYNLDPKKAFISPQSLKEKTKMKLKDLGLYELVNSFYPL